VTITGWYGGHGRAGSAQYTVNVDLDAGYHTIEFRHQERGGGDNYYLYWKKPGDSGYSIIPPENFFSCQTPPLKPAISPSCASPSPQLQLSTYDTVGYNTYPNDHTEYNSLVANYAVPAKIFGSGLVDTINGSGNPYDSANSEYLSVFKGYLYAPTDGIYQIGIDGDDAVEVIIDDEVITGWYGGHGRAGSAQYITPINLQAGYHDLEFRHQERLGGDNYYLYWQKPSDSSMSITSATNLFHCTYAASINLKKIRKVLSDPLNGTTNPKSIPGAVIEYTITALNSGNAPSDNSTIKDSLDNIISTQQTAIWASGFITIKTPNLYGGSKTTLTDAADSDEGEFNDTAGNRVLTVNCGTLTTNQSCEVTYRIIIN